MPKATRRPSRAELRGLEEFRLQLADDLERRANAMLDAAKQLRKKKPGRKPKP